MAIEISQDYQKILRTGLQSVEKKKLALNYIRESLPMSQERIMVEAAFKDPNVTYDDIDDILSGAHYEKYLKENVKREEHAKSILMESSELDDFIAKTDNFDEESDGKIPIIDSSGFEEKCYLNVDMAHVLEYKKRGDYFGGDPEDNLLGSKKFISAFDAMKNMSPSDQEDFMKSINHAYDAQTESKNKFITKDKYVDELNRQLSDEERIRFVNLVLKRSRDVLMSNKQR